MTAAVSASTICSPSADVVAREIEGEIVIVPVVAGIGDADDELYTLNETGHALWKKLDGQRSLAEVVDELEQEFDAPRATLEADVVGFAAEMVRRGILVTRD